MSRKETEANEVKFWEGVLTVPQQTTGYVCWSNLGFYEVLWVLALWFLWVVALWFLWVLALWLLAFCLSLFTPLSGHSSQSLVTVLREALFQRLDVSFARCLSEKNHVGACAMLVSLWSLMLLMFLMILYIRVLPYISNMMWQTLFSDGLKSFISKSFFLRAFCPQVLRVLTFSSSIPFVALAFYP